MWLRGVTLAYAVAFTAVSLAGYVVYFVHEREVDSLRAGHYV